MMYMMGMASRIANFIYPTVVGMTASTDAGGAPELIQSAMVDNILMRWEDHGPRGEKTPVIMVHGFPTHPRLWRYVIPRITRHGVRCLAWEMVGYGWSMREGLNREISIAQQAKYLRAWMRRMGIERAVLVGHDLGGGVVQRVAVENPELCAGLVLADSVAYDNWPVAPVRLSRALAGAIERMSPYMLKWYFAGAMMYLGYDEALRRMESMLLHWQPYGRPVGPMAFAHQLRSLDASDTLAIAQGLSGVRVPARIVWGEDDPLGVASARQLARDLDAQLLVIPNARHYTPEDHPGMVAQCIEQVLATIGVSVRGEAPPREAGEERKAA